jgi:DNA-binding GntR family transcriptional regulator
MKNKLEPRSISELAMDYIKDRLERGELKPGDRIDEKELSDTLGVSRTPIREALIQLSKDGVVEIRPRRDIRVRDFSDKELREIYQTIGILEAEAVVEALPHLKPDDIENMRQMIVRMKKAHAQRDLRTYLDVNLKLHNLPLSRCENSLLLQIITELRKRLYTIPRLMKSAPDWIVESIKDHDQLQSAIEEKNKNLIRKILRDVHWGPDRLYHIISRRNNH